MDQKPNTADLNNPRRRRFQYRLRTLLIGVVLLAILFSLGVWSREWLEKLHEFDRLILEGAPRH